MMVPFERKAAVFFSDAERTRRARTRVREYASTLVSYFRTLSIKKKRDPDDDGEARAEARNDR